MNIIEKVHHLDIEMYEVGWGRLLSEGPDCTRQQAVNFSGSFLKECDLRTQARQALHNYTFLSPLMSNPRV